MSGFWLWVAARPSYHLGASGLIYGLGSFVFFSGIIRKHTRLITLSMLVVFLYGGMVWGIFPIKEGISWEGHLYGAIAGIILAYFFKDKGLQRKVYSWEIEADDGIAEDDPNAYWNQPLQPLKKKPAIIYHFKKQQPQEHHQHENQ